MISKQTYRLLTTLQKWIIEANHREDDREKKVSAISLPLNFYFFAAFYRHFAVDDAKENQCRLSL